MADSRPLLDRLLKTPDLPKIVPHLQPEVLHRVIERCGLEDCAELVALATPRQLTRILDADVWRVRAPGADEAFDADRFGVWIAVLMQSGAAVAAEKLQGLDLELVIAGLTRHVAVFDRAAVSAYTTLDGEDVAGRALNDAVFETGGYVIEARRTSAWEPIVDLLAFLATAHSEYFSRVMRECVRLSSGPREEDGFHDLLDDDAQAMFDVAGDRHERREQEGYVAPAQARAFLREGRALRLDGAQPPGSFAARAYFRAIEPDATERDVSPAAETRSAPACAEAASPPDARAIADLVGMLRDAGVLEPQVRALLAAPEGPDARLGFVEAHVALHPASSAELAYLANVMLAGCTIQGRPFTIQEASDGAVAICNLGLENWPAHWPRKDLVSAFQIGWALLYRDVCTYAAERLIVVLAEIACADRETGLRLDGLRYELVRAVRDGEPWRVRNDLDVIITLDAVSWAGLLGLIDECPVLHGAVRASRQSLRAIHPTQFEFISQNDQIAMIRSFMASLPSALTR